MNLFALIDDPDLKTARFELSGDVQKQLDAYLREQAQAFETVERALPFDGKYKPDPGEVLYIDGFEGGAHFEAAVRNPLALEPIKPTEGLFNKIRAIFAGHETSKGRWKILFQNFDRRRIISTQGLSLFHADNVYKRIEGVGLTIDRKLSATLESGRLTFYSFHLARQVFDLKQHYREATDADVIEFACHDRIRANDPDALLTMSDTWVRQKIALIQQSGILSKVPLNAMKAVAREFGVPFETQADGSTETIRLPEKKAQLKSLLRFLDEDYYKSPLSNTCFMTNSKITLVPGR